MTATDSLAIWQAALLHDIGRLMQRAGESGDHAELGARWLDDYPSIFPPDTERTASIKEAISRHHSSPATRLDRIIQAADRLAAREGEQLTVDESSPLLVPPAARISLLSAAPKSTHSLLVGSLSLDKKAIFPTDQPSQNPTEMRESYRELISRLDADLKRSAHLSTRQGFVTLLAVLRKHTSLIPHTVSGENDEPYFTDRDISLFDHLKLTCAVAACLSTQEGDAPCFEDATLDAIAGGDQGGTPLAYLVRGEVSGIQNFIYHIARAESDKGGTARRLRGRSFYVALIVDLIADLLIRKLDLSPANILFCGGGRFDLLAPVSEFHREKIKKVEKEIERWLLDNFYGELSIQISYDTAIRAKDFSDFSSVHQESNERIAEMKRRKFNSALNDRFFLGWTDETGDSVPSEAQPIYRICPVCHITPIDDDKELCDQCKLHGEIGRMLPKGSTDFLAYIYKPAQPVRDVKIAVEFELPFELTAALVDLKQARGLLRDHTQITLFKLNEAEAFILDSSQETQAFDFKFLGNSAPVAKRDFDSNDPDRVLKAGGVFDFTNIASELTVGAKLLAALKMDVDYLGMIFGLGLSQHTLLRVSALSRSLDLFFNGWLNRICEEESKRWIDEKEERSGLTDNLFYIVYSGGDDLLIIGPWEQTLKLAQKIRSEFGEFCGDDPNITLSGGAVLFKPHFPVHRFAKLAEVELKRSKDIDLSKMVKGDFQKDRFTVFSQKVPWMTREEEVGFNDLWAFGDWLAKRVEDKGKNIPKSLVYLLLRLYDSYVKDENSWRSTVWLPKFTYATVRRVPLTVGEKNLGSELIQKAQQMISQIRIPVSYVSLKTRKE
jgi:CRISPR-associated protein Csm1